MSNKVYNVLKWVALVALDAIGLAYEQLAEVWSLPYGTEIMRTCTILSALLGTLIGVSSIQYAKKLKQETEAAKEATKETEKAEEEVG